LKILYHHRTQGEEPESVHIANIVAALRDSGHEVDILGPVKVSESRQAAPRSRLGRLKQSLPPTLLELAQLVYNLKSLWQLTVALRRGGYAFIYERYALYNVAGVVAARWFRIPLILEVNTPYAQAWAKYYGLQFPRLARAVERFVLRRADHLLTVTEVQRQLIEREGVEPQRITVTHNAIDPKEFAMARYAADGLRAELGLKALVIGFVGTMNRWQGMPGFVDVIGSVVAVDPEVSFLFVGDGEERPGLQQRINAAGLAAHVVFCGRQPHSLIPRFVACMDVGVLLDSNAYGSPMKVFEYWSMGKAVIAPSVAPVLEILTDNDTGLLIAPGDGQAMAKQILRLAADAALRARLGEAGRKQVLATHTWKQNAARILEAYASLSERSAPRAKVAS
jgi:glycosyltransferase involved in cell wall biosynthesis